MRALLLPGSCAGQLRRFRTPNLAPHFTAISGVFQEEEKLARRSRSADRLRTYGSALFFKRLINGQKVLGVSVTSVTSVRAFLLPGSCAGQLWRFCTPNLAHPSHAGSAVFQQGEKLARRPRSSRRLTDIELKDRLPSLGAAQFKTGSKRLINGQKVLGVSVTSVTSVRAFLLPGSCAGQLWRFCTPNLAHPSHAGSAVFQHGGKLARRPRCSRRLTNMELTDRLPSFGSAQLKAGFKRMING